MDISTQKLKRMVESGKMKGVPFRNNGIFLRYHLDIDNMRCIDNLSSTNHTLYSMFISLRDHIKEQHHKKKSRNRNIITVFKQELCNIYNDIGIIDVKNMDEVMSDANILSNFKNNSMEYRIIYNLLKQIRELKEEIKNGKKGKVSFGIRNTTNNN